MSEEKKSMIKIKRAKRLIALIKAKDPPKLHCEENKQAARRSTELERRHNCQGI
jgi:hypothetical protein